MRNRAASRCRVKAWAISATWQATALIRATRAARPHGTWAAVRGTRAAAVATWVVTVRVHATWAAEVETAPPAVRRHDRRGQGHDPRVPDPRAPLVAEVARARVRPAVAAACR